MGLDFIPVGVEEYDFAIPQKFLEVPAVKAFIEILQSEEFQSRLGELGGYEIRNAGEIVNI
jgi:putative molybdopterin biosynthesis protein